MIVTISKPFLVALLACSSFFLCAQIPITFSNNYGDSDKNIIQDVIDLDGQGCLTIGYTKNETTRNGDMWITRVNNNGTLVWSTNFGSTCFESANAAAMLDDGTIVIVGQGRYAANNASHKRNDGAILKIDINGNLIWQRTFGDQGHDQFTDVVALPNGQCVAVGATSSYTNVPDSRATDGWAVRVNSNGSAMWNNTFGGSLMDRYTSVLIDAAGDLLIGGSSNSNDGDITNSNGLDDLWVSKISTSGDHIWSQKYGGTDNDVLDGMSTTLDGGYILAGTSYSSLPGAQGNGDIFILKISSQGNSLWQQNYGGTFTDKSTDIINFEGDGFLLAATTFSDDGDIQSSYAEQDAWIAKLDPNGNIIWQQTLGGSENDALHALAISDNGDLWLGGYSFSLDQDLPSNLGAQDAWLIGSNMPSVPNLELTEDINHVTCFDFSDGSIALTVTGDAPPFSFMWSNGFSSSAILGLSPGDYTVTVTDANDFQLIKSYTITEPEELKVIEEQTNAQVGQSDGSILLNIIGGTPSYNVQWSNGGQGILQENLAAGEYIATITDANDCQLIVAYEIEMGTATAQIIRDALDVFPSPNQGTFTVFIPQALRGKITAEMLSLDGRRVNLGVHNHTSSQLSLIMQQAIPGLYILTLRDNNYLYQSKIVVQP
jgi:hypothetical protein